MTRERMKRPTLEEVQDYIDEKGYSVDPDEFFNYYEANGWYVGRRPMKSWKNAVAYWQSRRKQRPGGRNSRVRIKSDPDFDGRF